MVYLIKTILLPLLLNIVSHEGGHWLPAWKFGLNPKFKFSRSLSPVQVRWNLTNDKENRIIATMGFGFQMIVGLLLFLLFAFLQKDFFWVDRTFVFVYFAILIVHFCLYPFRNKDNAANDFSKMDGDEDPGR